MKKIDSNRLSTLKPYYLCRNNWKKSLPCTLCDKSLCDKKLVLKLWL